MTIEDAALDRTLIDNADRKQRSRSSLLTPLAVFIALSLTDAIVSAFLLHVGLMREANPMMRVALDYLGLAGAICIKLAISAAAAALLAAYHRALPRFVPRLAWTANALYLLIWGSGFLAANFGALSLLSAL
jgi:hypothetical protein